MLRPALPQPQREQADAYLVLCRTVALLGEDWARWRATRPDPADIERMRADIGEMLSDQVGGRQAP